MINEYPKTFEDACTFPKHHLTPSEQPLEDYYVVKCSNDIVNRDEAGYLTTDGDVGTLEQAVTFPLCAWTPKGVLYVISALPNIHAARVVRPGE